MPLLSWSRAFRRLHPVTEISKSASIAAVTGIRAVDFMGRGISFSWARIVDIENRETVYACRFDCNGIQPSITRGGRPVQIHIRGNRSFVKHSARRTRAATNNSGGGYHSRTARVETIPASNQDY